MRPGQFLADLLLKLGLLGTIIGFILMLTPIGEIKEFDPSLIQQLLSTMSGGMAVALYTTLAGLLTSSLLKVQCYFLDSVLVSHESAYKKTSRPRQRSVLNFPDETPFDQKQIGARCVYGSVVQCVVGICSDVRCSLHAHEHSREER